MALLPKATTNVENNVGWYGPSDGTIGRYKDAAESASEAEYWAKQAETGISDITNLQKVTQGLQATSQSQAAQIQQLEVDFNNNTTQLQQLNADTIAAANSALQSVQNADQAAQEAKQAADDLHNIKLAATPVDAVKPPTASYDATTNTLTFEIPKGESGKLDDIANTPAITPNAQSRILIAGTDDKPYLATVGDLVSTVAVTKVNGQTGDVTLDAGDVGLGNVLNVPSYSKAEADARDSGFFKAYPNEAAADADLPNRKDGEIIVVYNYDEDPSHPKPQTLARREWYKVTAGQKVAWGNGEKTIRSINGALPNDAGDVSFGVQTGNPSLWLGEVVMFPYNPDPTKQITYPGILRADGTSRSITGYPELLKNFKAGLVPYVSMTEWDAGAKTMFAWDGSDTGNFRTPDWTDGTVLRSPEIVNPGSTDPTNPETSSEVKGKVYDQAPYITSINGQTPDESSGSIYILPEMIGALGGTSFTAVDQSSLSDWDYISKNGFYSVPGRPSDIPDALGSANVQGILVNYASQYSGGTSVVQNLYAYTGALYTRTGSIDPAPAQTVVWKDVGVNGGDSKGWKVFSTTGLAQSGRNTDITELASLTVPITKAQGGFGASWTAKDETTVAPLREALNITSVATMNFGQAANTVCAGNDNRLRSAGNAPENFASGDDIRIKNFDYANGKIGIQILNGDLTIQEGHAVGTQANTGALSIAGDFTVNTDKFTVDSATGNTKVGGDLTVSNVTTSGSIHTAASGVTVAPTATTVSNQFSVSNPTTAPVLGGFTTNMLFTYFTDNFTQGPISDGNQKIASYRFSLNGNMDLDFRSNGLLVSPIDLTDTTAIADADLIDNAYVTRKWVEAHAGSGGGTGGGVSQTDFDNLKDKVEDGNTGLDTKAPLTALDAYYDKTEIDSKNFLDQATADSAYGIKSDLTLLGARDDHIEQALIHLIARVVALETKAAVTPTAGASVGYQANNAFTPT